MPEPSDWPSWASSQSTSQPFEGTPAKVLRRTTPIIKSHWFRDGIHAHVIFRLEITPEGQLGRVAYQPADTDKRIVNAVITSLKRWKFTPSFHNGQPVTTYLEQPYEIIFEPSAHYHPPAVSP